MELLLRAGQGAPRWAVDAPLNDGRTALMLACKNGHLAAAELLLQHRADPCLHECPVAAAGAAAGGLTALMLATQFGKTACAAAVLKATGAPRLVDFVNATSTRGEMALGIAARHGHPNPNPSPSPNPNPNPNPNRNRNRNRNPNPHPTPTQARHGHRNLAVLLLRHRAAVDTPNGRGAAPLHLAARHGHVQVLHA